MDTRPRDEPASLFCLAEEENDKAIVGVKPRGGAGRDGATSPPLTFIMLKGHREHPASSSAPVAL